MTNSATYNSANAEGRAKQLRSARVDDSQIENLAKSSFESLPANVQKQLTSA